MKNANITFTAILTALVCLGLLPGAQAVVPPPDGGYPNLTTAEGQNALLHLTTGTGNTALGWFSLDSVTTGSFNTGVGAGTLALNTADGNTATGTVALFLNTTGTNNTADGAFALLHNSEGSDNTATGAQALFNNTIGAGNTASGKDALLNNTTGTVNTAVGDSALKHNDNGNFNTGIGESALFNNVAGAGNTAIGESALENNTGTANIALGVGADNNIEIGNVGIIGEAETIRIGTTQTSTFIAGISGATAAGGTAVFINGNGQLGTLTSSRRFKDEIQPMDTASEVLFSLKPVSFRYKKEIDPAGTSQFGLVAEDVEKVSPDLVIRDKDGKPYTVRYEQVNAMLLNEFLKEHKKVEEQQATIAELKSTVAQQQKSFQSQLANQGKQMQALRSGLEKVSAQLELSKSRPQAVLNNQ